jgi:hypothetical protein
VRNYTGSFADKILVRNIVDLVWMKSESAWLTGDKTFTGPGTFSGILSIKAFMNIEWLEHNHGPEPEQVGMGRCSQA